MLAAIRVRFARTRVLAECGNVAVILRAPRLITGDLLWR